MILIGTLRWHQEQETPLRLSKIDTLVHTSEFNPLKNWYANRATPRAIAGLTYWSIGGGFCRDGCFFVSPFLPIFEINFGLLVWYFVEEYTSVLTLLYLQKWYPTASVNVEVAVQRLCAVFLCSCWPRYLMVVVSLPLCMVPRTAKFETSHTSSISLHFGRVDYQVLYLVVY